MRRIFVAKFEDREVPLEIERTADGLYRVLLEGSEQRIDARIVAGGLSLLVDGRNHEVSLSRQGEDFDVLVENHRFRFELLSEERARKVAARQSRDVGGRREVKASMPGKVIDVLVKVGDAVEPKQGVLIIEAMKMENEIKSPGAGTVQEVRVRPGEAVEAGGVLIVIE